MQKCDFASALLKKFLIFDADNYFYRNNLYFSAEGCILNRCYTIEFTDEFMNKTGLMIGVMVMANLMATTLTRLVNP